jgi:uncharacterized protein (DUF1778 family)
MTKEQGDLRLTRAAEQTLQAAAATERKSASEFVLDTALSQAEERLADRHIFTLDPKNWDAFVSALDAPPPCAGRAERSVFDRKSGP